MPKQNVPSQAIIALQRAKTALETDPRRMKDPEIGSALEKIYKSISARIYDLEARENLPYGWRNGSIYGEAGKTGSIVRLVMTEDTPTADFLCQGRAIKDPEGAMRRAVQEYLRTPQGKAYLTMILGAASFNWGDAVDQVPQAIWEKHGLKPLEPVYSATITVEHDERLND